MLVKEYITQELEFLSNTELQQLAEYLAFLKFRTRLHPLSIQATDEKLQDLYAQFEDEDLVLAESGLEEYVAILALEDEA
jgi:hypothetical protein